MTVLSAIVDHARRDPGRLAVKDTARALSYGALVEQIRRTAGGLVARGIARGDRVALHLPNSIDFPVLAGACQWIGAILVPLSFTDPWPRTAMMLEDCRPRVLVARPGRRATDAARPAERVTRADRGDAPWSSVSPEELAAEGLLPGEPAPGEGPAYCIYTSGTTGTPKGVVVGTKALSASTERTVAALGLRPESRSLCVSPFHFDGSFGTVFPTLMAGGLLMIARRERVLLPREFFRTLAAEEITHTSFSPSLLRLLLLSSSASCFRGSKLQTLCLGGEQCDAADVRQVKQLAPGLRVFNRYGPTEATVAVTTFELTDEVLSSRPRAPIGQPYPGVTFYLVDGDGGLAEGPGATGELYIGGDQLMDGYWDAPELTEQVMRTDLVPGERLYRTGDLVRRDEEGDYVYLDRLDQVVNVNGTRVSLAEITARIIEHPRVLDAFCALREDAETLEAFVVLSKGLSPKELREHLVHRLPASEVPAYLRPVPSIPLTAAGKVDLTALRASLGTT